MYNKGDLKHIVKSCGEYTPQGFGCVACGEFHSVSDTRSDNEDHTAGVFLSHSCEEWYIGGVEEVDQLIVDLLEWKHGLIDK